MKEGERKIDEAIDKAGVPANGWRLSSLFGDAAFVNGDWLKRAAGAKAGIYGNNSVEATYPLGKFNSEDKPLDGSKHDYTLTFPAGQLPPVECLLVGDDVRWQNSAADRKSDQPVSDQ